MRHLFDSANHAQIRGNSIFALLISAIMIDGLYITNENYILLSPIRFYATLAVGILIVTKFFLIALLSRQSRSLMLFLLAHSTLLIYGLMLSTFYGGVKYFDADKKLVLYLLISVVFGYTLATLFVSSLKTANQRSSSIVLPIFFSCSFIYLLSSKAIQLGAIPYFNFEDIGGESTSYSQSTSFLFGVGALYFLLSAHESTRFKSLILFTISIMFLYFSAMGGARGDFGLGLILYILILFVSRSAYSLVALVLLITLISYAIYNDGLIDNFLVLERFLHLYETGDLGERDFLFEKAINLLADNISCLVFGCGFNYFQYYFSYDYGMYPHNIVLEFLITFGVFLFSPLIIMAFKGVFIILKGSRVDKFFLYFTFYVFLISLKSGSLISFMAIPIILFYAFIPCFHKSIKANKFFDGSMPAGPS
jgi:hypothetical protein